MLCDMGFALRGVAVYLDSFFPRSGSAGFCVGTCSRHSDHRMLSTDLAILLPATDIK